MSRITTIDYEKISKENLRKVLSRREYHRALDEALKGHNKGGIFIVETPAENYLEANVNTVKSMIDNGFEGIYMSFQRPYNNISSLFDQVGVDLSKIIIIDGATGFSGDYPEDNTNCVSIPPDAEIEDVVKAIYKSLELLTCDKRFVMVDSISTLGLHEPSSETLRFPEFLINTVKRGDFNNITFLFNVAKDLSRKRYIENISLYADEYIHLGLCT